MNLPLAPSSKEFGAKPQPKRSHPSSQFQSVAEGEDAFLALFLHRHDYIWAEHPQLTAKPQWQTESRHPLSDRLILQGGYLYGVRFGPKTNYLLFDIDSGSLYHPRHDPFAIPRLVAALEALELVSYIAVTSSYSGGIHLYFPFEKAQKSHELAQAAQALLENAGFVLSLGQLELFPNDRGFVDGKPALYAAHRLPLQLGSYLLNHEWEPTYSIQAAFVQQWQHCQRRNPVTTKTVKHILRIAKRQRLIPSGKANKFLNDLNAEIEPGWSGSGQTNRLLGRIALRTYIFGKLLYGFYLEGKALVDKIVEVATSLPDYRSYCGHQHEIEHRAEEWAQCVENSSRYFPYQRKAKSNPVHTSQPTQSTTPSWHEMRQEESRERISSAIAGLLESNTLPVRPTARFNALVRQGIGGGTLYKHKDLWHPECLLPVENPPHPPVLASERIGDAPECPSLLGDESSNALLGKGLNDFGRSETKVINSNTQSEAGGIESVKQRVAEIKALQDYKRAAQKEAWEQLQLIPQPTTPSPAHIAQMQQWLESGDPILVAEAEVFFKCKQNE